MSTSFSSEDSSISLTSEGNPFHGLGEFDWGEAEGPARSIPTALRALQLDSRWIVEFNELSAFGLPTKNHVTSRVLLAKPYITNGVSYCAVRISMELSEVLINVIDNDEPGSFFHQSLESGHDYYPGCFTVKLLGFSTPSLSCLQSRTFTLSCPLTLGQLIDVVLDESMDEYVFLPYENQWKGCRDFMLQMWAALVRQNKLEKLSEEYGTRLSEDIGYTHYPGGKSVYFPVKKGCWVRWERFLNEDIETSEFEEEVLVPPSVYHMNHLQNN